MWRNSGRIWYDTESCGFFSPTILIQYQLDNGSDIVLHDIFSKPVEETVNLIEMFMENELIGFNLAHDHFHLSRTYGVFKLLPQSAPPKVMDIFDLENEPDAHNKYCLKPKGALDLMAYGRSYKLQSTMNQKPIKLKRVPKELARDLIRELEVNINFNPLLFAKGGGEPNWQIKPLLKGTAKELKKDELDMPMLFPQDDKFVNIHLSFHPSTGLKAIAKYMLHFEDVDEIEYMTKLKNPVEYAWFPSAGEWVDVIDEHINEWTYNRRRREYAVKDVLYTRALYDNLVSLPSYPDLTKDLMQDIDSSLACSIGALHWKGYDIDLPAVGQLLNETEAELSRNLNKLNNLNVNAPKQVVTYLKRVADEDEEDDITSSSKDLLKEIVTDEDDIYTDALKDSCTLVMKTRKLQVVQKMCTKLLRAKKLYATYKVVGTKSNRMSAGTLDGGKKGGSISLHGIKGSGSVRELFTLTPEGWELSSGDFDGFEVSIAEAVYGDENLRKDLISGKSFHALWGSYCYNMPYEEILATNHIEADEPNGYYKRSKISMFAQLYGAQVFQMSKTLGLEPKVVLEAKNYFESHYKGIKETRDLLEQDFSAMTQPNGLGTEIVWKEPKKYVESFLGFKRDFAMEFEVIRQMFILAQDLPSYLVEMGQLSKYKRKDKYQTGGGCIQSTLYASAFSLQSALIRAALNHLIQSPGGQLTKELQNRIWGLQPVGIHGFKVMPFNVHDEVQCPHVPELREEIKMIVEEFIKEKRELVPLMSMEWKTNLNSWGDK